MQNSLENEILLIGANGQLGSEISNLLNIAKISFDSLVLPDLDLAWDNKLILDYLLKNYPNKKFIILAAALTNTTFCEKNPQLSYKINGDSLQAICKYTKEVDATLIHFSTDYVFDGEKGTPYVETDPCSPLNVYGRSKLVGEFIVQDFLNKFFIFRISSLFGVYGNNFIENIINKSKTENNLTIVDDQITSPTHTSDVAEAVLNILKNNIQDYGIYHLSNLGACTWFEFAKDIFRIYNPSFLDKISPIKSNAFPSALKRPMHSALSTVKIQNTFYTPVSWQNAIKNYFNQRSEIKE